jgi:hypothetical protein
VRDFIGDRMAHVYRITKGAEIGQLVESREALVAFGRENGPGLYQVDEHSALPFHGSKATARACGTVIHQPDGQVTFKPFFFGNHYAGADCRPIDVRFPVEFRGAYRQASRWIELLAFKGACRQEFDRHVRHLTEPIRAAVIRQMRYADRRVVGIAVKAAIDDAIEGREPRWLRTPLIPVLKT